MNYNVCGVVIRSENAAKPYTMASKDICEYIRKLEKNGCALDYGCGKLRYSEQLVEKFENVTFLDSKKQLERVQMIRGEKTTVLKYIDKNYKKANYVFCEDVEKIVLEYDFILCANVLSAIPCQSTIDNIFLNIKRLLSLNGEALIVNQYKCSSFNKYKNGTEYLYGHINKNCRGSFYYGLLSNKLVESICLRNGLSVINSWSKNGSSYVSVAI